jgi:hypothetical protein
MGKFTSSNSGLKTCQFLIAAFSAIFGLLQFYHSYKNCKGEEADFACCPGKGEEEAKNISWCKAWI